MPDIISGTPAEMTYLHPIVREAWMVVWVITSAALVAILGWMGLSFTIQEHLGQVPAGLAGDGPAAPPRARGGRHIAVVVRSRDRRGRRRLRLRRPERR